MASYIDFARLSKLVKAKRGDRGLRETAEEIGDISPSTLSRIEGERVDDVATSTLLRICDWLNVAPSEIIKDAGAGPVPEIDLASFVELQLRAKKDLDPTMARMLSEMFKAAYKEAQKNKPREQGK
jgi:DNA-binding Xre family transcriptional regulator